MELRNLDEARDYILQGLWFQRVAVPSAALVRPALEWAMEIVSSGQPMPPIGFIADLGNLAFGNDRGRATKDRIEVPGWPHGQAREYEDHLLGKIYADWSFERATDALRRLTEPRDRIRGLAYVVTQIRKHAKLDGVELSPAVLRGLMNAPPDDTLAKGYELLTRDGPHPLLLTQYDDLKRAARRMAEVLTPEDVIALEQRTALADMGQYVAHRQILQMTARMEATLPIRPVRPHVGRKEVPTRVLDEDHYPVGGYSSISTHGSIESLLHSQLAYMEPDGPPGDLFDLKFVRDELFYYSRDENQFLRRRRLFLFVFDPSLTGARFKDAEIPTQRIVLVLATVLTVIRRLTDWLSADALQFQLVFLHPGATGLNRATRKDRQETIATFLKTVPLAHEAELMQLLLQEFMQREAVEFAVCENASALESLASAEARTSQVQCLTLATQDLNLDPEGAIVSRLIVDGPKPTLRDASGGLPMEDGDDAFDHWGAVVRRILELWV